MYKLIILCFFIYISVSLQGSNAPIWPQVFSQDFIQTDSRIPYYETGKFWYDYTNNRQIFDFSGSRINDYCYGLGQDYNAICSLINVNGSLYINLPQNNKCCKCCRCQIFERDWLKNFAFKGQWQLGRQKFNKWTFSPSNVEQNYYASQDIEQIPRRLDVATYAMDFIMNTYSRNRIQESVFQLPNSCNTRCPNILQYAGCRQDNNDPIIKMFLTNQIQLNLKI